MTQRHLTIAPLPRRPGPEGEHDIRHFAVVRLDAPSAFLSTYELERAGEPADWMARLDASAWFVASWRGQPVGLAAGESSWDRYPTERDLVGMWVRPSHRRMGVAAQLVTSVRDWATDQAADTLALWIIDGNAAARSAYLKYGFNFVRTAPSARDPSVMAHKFALPLPVSTTVG